MIREEASDNKKLVIYQTPQDKLTKLQNDCMNQTELNCIQLIKRRNESICPNRHH